MSKQKLFLLPGIFCAMSVSAQQTTPDSHLTLQELFFPGQTPTVEMTEAMRHIQVSPLPGKVSIEAAANVFKAPEGMNGDWRPAEVIGCDKDSNKTNRYIYYYDKNGTFSTPGTSMVRIYQQWNATDKVWANASRFKQIYDDRNDMVEYYSDRGFNDTWNNWYHSFFTYDHNHNTLTACQQTWFEEEWFSVLRWTNEYDSKGRILTQTYESRPAGTETWSKGSRIEWAYDDAGRQLKYVMLRWNENSGKYEPSIGEFYTYNDKGNMLTHEREQNGKKTYLITYEYDANDNRIKYKEDRRIDDAWGNYLLIDYTYDEQNREKERISQIWDGTQQDGAWKLNRRQTWMYAPSATAEVFYKYDAENSKWLQSERIVTNFDAKGRVTRIGNDAWSDQLNMLKTYRQELYAFDNNGLLTSKKIQTWNAAENRFDDITNFAFTYDDNKNCSNITATAKQSKEWIFAPYNDMKDEWACSDYEPYIGDVTYLNINDYVEPTGISMDTEECEIELELNRQLTASVAPANVSNPEVYWKSSDDKVARVSVAGKVYGISEGHATITATTMDGRYTATCKVKVVDPSGIGSTVADFGFSYSGNTVSFGAVPVSVNVFDMTGRSILSASSATEISTAGWAKGAYLVRVSSASASRTYKIFVK